MATMAIGPHKVIVIGTALDDKGHGQVVVQFRNAAGDSISWYGSLSTVLGEGKKKTAYDVTEETLAKIGWVAADHDYDFSGLNNQPSPIDGAETEIVVADEPYTNPTTKEAKTIRKVKQIGGGLRHLDDDKATTFAESLKAKIAARKGITIEPKRAPF
jgi:hypothetical protein